MGMVEAFTRRWNDHNAEYLTVQRQALDRATYFPPQSNPSVSFCNPGSGFGAWLVIQQEISPG
ncbi:MAG: hypothetical protein R3B74_10330 [Nitrospirales bacterium]|nr:hypothetical protein [Nitrospirales bacterium]